MRSVLAPEAQAFIERSTFHWYQSFDLGGGIYTPGVADVASRVRMAIEGDLSGKTILDIGANNGGVCFEAERRGATDVLAVDIAPSDFFGFDQLRAFLDSSAGYMKSTIYELPDRLAEPRDVVFCLGLLYHLRHPLLGLDALRSVTREYAIIETEISDWQFDDPTQSVARFYRKNELNHDGSNWFTPTTRCFIDWCWSAGFEPELLGTFPADAPRRALIRAVPVPGVPEYMSMSYDRPLKTIEREPWMRQS